MKVKVNTRLQLKKNLIQTIVSHFLNQKFKKNLFKHPITGRLHHGKLCLRLGEQWTESGNLSRGLPKDMADRGREQGSQGDDPLYALGSPRKGFRNVERIVHHLGVLQVHGANWDSVDRFVNGFSTGILFREERLSVVPWDQLPSLAKATVWLPGFSKPTEVLLRWIYTYRFSRFDMFVHYFVILRTNHYTLLGPFHQPPPHLCPWISKCNSFVSASLVHVSARILFVSAPSSFRQSQKHHLGCW